MDDKELRPILGNRHPRGSNPNMPDQMYQGQLPQGAMPPQQMGPNATPQQMGFPMYAQAGMPQQHLQQHPQQHPQQQFGYQMPAMQHPPSQPMQPQRHTFTLKSVDAPVFVPRGMQAAPANGVPNMAMPPPRLTANQDPMTQLKQAISALTSDPDVFDSLIGRLNQELSTGILTEDTLNSIIEEIFSQSILVSSFRTTAAKMCNYFSNNLTKEFPSGTFKSLLLSRCQQEHSKRDILAQNCDTRRHLIGFTVFMGELLLTDRKNDVNRSIIHDLLVTILKDPTDENLRCVAQVLKLCGIALDEGDSPEVMNNVIEQIKDVVLADGTKKSLRNLLVYVIELRAGKWGSPSNNQHSTPSSAPTSAPAAPAYAAPQPQAQAPMPVSAEPAMSAYSQQGMRPQGQPMVYVDESGQPIPYEEYPGEEEYYDEYAQADWSQGNDSYSFPEASEMDDEIAAAFEEFIKQQPQQQ
ncbi:hypothetical protein CAPTEDRAFT_226784 [Capitella teleta]|uniref:MIF4G domain-containing protein n=1 Tax=Capitella teleta TaxID=283909 RepID=N1PB49_CAPTE|nr:hypothetical protein CAPTEDRAFT_226784 [Capitella teleta]|eukprot:ELU18892.1 hypothetical protein CAPTEDRAFT_226784 [Capitella teleta]